MLNGGRAPRRRGFDTDWEVKRRIQGRLMQERAQDVAKIWKEISFPYAKYSLLYLCTPAVAAEHDPNLAKNYLSKGRLGRIIQSPHPDPVGADETDGQEVGAP